MEGGCVGLGWVWVWPCKYIKYNTNFFFSRTNMEKHLQKKQDLFGGKLNPILKSLAKIACNVMYIYV